MDTTNVIGIVAANVLQNITMRRHTNLTFRTSFYVIRPGFLEHTDHATCGLAASLLRSLVPSGTRFLCGSALLRNPCACGAANLCRKKIKSLISLVWSIFQLGLWNWFLKNLGIRVRCSYKNLKTFIKPVFFPALLLTVPLLRCFASRPVIGWLLCVSNFTQTKDIIGNESVLKIIISNTTTLFLKIDFLVISNRNSFRVMFCTLSFPIGLGHVWAYKVSHWSDLGADKWMNGKSVRINSPGWIKTCKLAEETPQHSYNRCQVTPTHLLPIWTHWQLNRSAWLHRIE